MRLVAFHKRLIYMNTSVRYEWDYSFELRFVDRIEANSEYIEGMPATECIRVIDGLMYHRLS